MQGTASVPVVTAEPAVESESRYLEGWRRFASDRLAVLGLAIIAVVIFAAIFAPWVAPFDPNYQYEGLRRAVPGVEGHLLGTDEVGRDILARILHGIRTDLLITLVAVPTAALLGTALGLLGALHRALGDAVQRVFDVLLAVPVIVLGVAFALALGTGVRAVIITVVLATLPTFGRQAHAALTGQLGREYVTAAVVVGTPRRRILTRHILPNVVDGVVALTAVSMATAVTIEGGLSVMGLGVVPPQPSLGTMIRDGAPYLFDQPQYAMAPVAVVVLLVLGYTLLADALNAAVLRK
jgi:peptide/nickel transport system permease protein